MTKTFASASALVLAIATFATPVLADGYNPFQQLFAQRVIDQRRADELRADHFRGDQFRAAEIRHDDRFRDGRARDPHFAGDAHRPAFGAVPGRSAGGNAHPGVTLARNSSGTAGGKAPTTGTASKSKR